MKILLALVMFGCAWAQAPLPPLDEILSRVAANQETSRQQRLEWVYSQKQLLRMLRGNGKVAREERREYTIAPKTDKFEKQLVKLEGKYESHGQYTAYDQPNYHYKGMDIDSDILNSMSEEMTNDKDSRDGIGKDLFPFTKAEQEKYTFRIKGSTQYRGRPAIRLAFEPRPHDQGDGANWKGEALIDAGEFQPVLVTTSLAWHIPGAVKILLGTNIKGLGFSVSYQKFADGVWFPVSYGGEFEVRAVFFYKRKISVAMTNGDFRRTDVTTHVAYSMDDK